MFLNTVCRSLCRELAVSHTCLSETQFAWFHTLFDNHFIYYSTITAIEALKSTENLYVHNFIRCVWVRDWDSETERQRLKDRGKERKSLHCVPVFLLSIVKCMHGCQLEIVELFFFSLDVSSSVRCVHAFSMGNRNAAVILIVCMVRDLTTAERGEKWKCCTLVLLWPEMDLFEDIDFFCPRTQKCNICTPHNKLF